MADFGDPRVSAVLTLVDLALDKDKDDPRRQYRFLDHVRECLERRLADARAAVAADVRRDRGKTPPPRRPSGAFTTLHSRAQTEPHNTDALVAQAEAERELGDRPTPKVPDPLEPVLGNTHPGRERDRR